MAIALHFDTKWLLDEVRQSFGIISDTRLMFAFVLTEVMGHL